MLSSEGLFALENYNSCNLVKKEREDPNSMHFSRVVIKEVAFRQVSILHVYKGITQVAEGLERDCGPPGNFLKEYQVLITFHFDSQFLGWA